MSESETPEPTPELTTGEVELKRRIGDLAALATVDGDQEWEKLQERLAANGGRATSPAQVRTALRTVRRRPVVRRVAAAAALVLLGAVILLQDDGDGRVHTVDDTTTTTDDDGASTTSTTADPQTTTSTPPDVSSPPPGSSEDSTGAPGDDPAAGPGAGAGGTGSDDEGAAGSPGGTSPSDTAPEAIPPSTVPAGEPPSVTYPTGDYTLKAWFREANPTTYYMTIWRDGYGMVSDLVASIDPDHNCLAGKSGSFAFPEPGLHMYSWGFVRADAAEVRVVTHAGEWTTAVIGDEAVPGLRPWIAARQTDQISRFEARDAAGNVLHTAVDGGVWAEPSTC
jgi:hypothetical protein